MSEELLPFGQKCCPKCRYGTDPVGGEERVETTYQEAVSEECSHVAGVSPCLERLRRGCLRCGHAWYERVADADE